MQQHIARCRLEARWIITAGFALILLAASAFGARACVPLESIISAAPPEAAMSVSRGDTRRTVIDKLVPDENKFDAEQSEFVIVVTVPGAPNAVIIFGKGVEACHTLVLSKQKLDEVLGVGA